MAGERTLDLRGVVKSYGHVRALRGVSFAAAPGEIVGLIGANGAGKSTLVKVIAGVARPDEGTVAVGAREVTFHSPRDALAAGVALVPQELSLVDDQTVAENLYIGRLPGRGGVVRERELRARARAALERVGLPGIDPGAKAGTLTPVEQRLLTIAEALSKEPMVLMLDEPSAALPSETAARLEPILKSVAAAGTTVIYVSHRLAEVQRLADRVYAMRDGLHAGDLVGDEITIPAMVELVGGRALDEEPAPEQATVDQGPVLVSARGVCGQRVQDLDLELRQGEIVGIGGLQGSGRSELLRLLGGVQRTTAGALDVLGHGAPSSPHDAVGLGVGYVPEGRKAMVFPEMSVAENSTIAMLRRVARMGTFVDTRRERELASAISQRVRLKGELDAPIRSLSGGNQQKACITRWLLKDVRLLLLDEPTVGIDVHARAEIHTLLRELAEEGTTIVVACSEPEELVLLCHRVVVLAEGRVTRRLSAPFDVNSVVAASYAS